MSVFALKCPFNKSHWGFCDAYLRFWASGVGGRLPALLLPAPLCGAFVTGHHGGGDSEENVFTFRSDYRERLWIQGSLLGGQLKCGTPPCLEQVSVVLAVQIGRYPLEPKAFPALHQPSGYSSLLPAPRPSIPSGTMTVTICENLCRTKDGQGAGAGGGAGGGWRGVTFLCLLSSYCDGQQEKCSTCPLWVYFLLFLLLQFAFLNFWPRRGK